MNSAKLFYNKAIIKSDLKRYWWLGAGFTILFLLLFALPFLEACLRNADSASHIKYHTERYNDYVFRQSMFGAYSHPSFVVCMILPAAMGVFLFSYMHRQSTVTTMHGFPLRRETLFFSHIISGIIMIAGAILINVLVFCLFRTNSVVWMWCSNRLILIWAANMLLYSMLIFSLSVMCSMAAGNMAAGFVLTYVIAAVPWFVEEVLNQLIRNYLYGYASNGSFGISDTIYMQYMNTTVFGVVLYIVLIAAFSAIALVLYKKRQLENHSSVVAFKILRPVLIYSFAVCVGFIGYFYMDIWEYYGIAFMIAFGIIGIIAAKMLIELSLKPKGVVRPIIIYCLFVAALFSSFIFDITGYERRVPKPENIEYVYMNDFVLDGYENDEMKITNPETIKNITALHKLAAGEGKSNVIVRPITSDENEYLRKNIFLYYKLKNGKTLVRHYHTSEFIDAFKKVYEDEAFKKELFVPLFDSEVSVSSAVIQSGVFGNIYIADPPMQNELIDAAKKDAMLVTHDEYYSRCSQDIGLSLTLTTPHGDAKYIYDEYKYIDRYSGSNYVYMYESSKNLREIAEKLDIPGKAEEKAGEIYIDESLISDSQKRKFICSRVLFSKKGVIAEPGSNIQYKGTDGVTVTEVADSESAGNEVIKKASEAIEDGIIYVKIGDKFTKMPCTSKELNWLLGD